MWRRAQGVGVYLIGFAAIWFSCGSPQVVSPDSLEAVYLPLAGASGVPLDAQPGLYFSDDVDADSVTGESVYLESGVLEYDNEKAKWVCSGPWESAGGQPEVNPGNTQMVIFTPEALLAAETCYRLVCTTAVRGMLLGPLRSARIPDMPGVAAVQVFSTGAE